MANNHKLRRFRKVAARKQAPRSLWDPAYTETSWITQFSTLGPIKLIGCVGPQAVLSLITAPRRL